MILRHLLDPVLPRGLSEVLGGAAGENPRVVGSAEVAAKDATGIRVARRPYLSPGSGGGGVRGPWTGGRPGRRWAEGGSGWWWRW